MQTCSQQENKKNIYKFTSLGSRPVREMTAAGSADGLSLFTAHVEGAGGGLLWLYVWNIVIIVGVYTPLTVAATSDSIRRA